MEVVVGPVELEQVGVAPLGGVMVKLIAPVGWAVPVPATPVIVAVKVVVPPRVGLADAVRVINGVCCANVTVAAVADLLV